MKRKKSWLLERMTENAMTENVETEWETEWEVEEDEATKKPPPAIALASARHRLVQHDLKLASLPSEWWDELSEDEKQRAIRLQKERSVLLREIQGLEKSLEKSPPKKRRHVHRPPPRIGLDTWITPKRFRK